MFSQNFQRATKQQPSPLQKNVEGSWTSKDVDPRVTVHYGIPSTASILAFDAVQSLLAVGTSDGRIKVIGGDNVEGLLVSPKQSTFKNLEFLQNQGFLVSVSNKNEIQVWDLEDRRITSTLLWESIITAFSVIFGTNYMYIGDEYGTVSVLKYDAEEGKLLQMPYYVPTNTIDEAAGISSSNHYSVVGLLPQPCSQGKRLLIAYENGLIILWDVSEDRVVLVKGNKDLQLKGETVHDPSKGASHELSETVSGDELAEKEISSLCWASNDGAVLAVGYVDGDITFWKLPIAASTKDQKAENSSNDVVKLQLSSGKRRLPVINLYWSADRSSKDCGGQLFVYGGDEIGSEEVLTMLYINWSSGKESLKYVGRVDLKLNGSFVDMVLLPSVSMTESCGTMLFVLTNPGQLHVYDGACLSFSISQQEKKTSSSSLQYPMIIPTIEPQMTVGKLSMVHRDGKLSMDLLKTVSAAKVQAPQTPSTQLTGSTKWPLTGAVPCQFFDAEDYLVERLYIAGYQDGSVRIWDATYPTLSLIHVLGSELAGIGIAGASAPVSALEFCSSTLCLVIGNAFGMVCIYKLIRSSNEASLNFVTETGKEVHILPQGDGPECKAVFSFLNSPVCNLEFANFGARLAVGFECGQVAMLDISTSSVLFVTESLSNSSSPVIYLAVESFSDTNSLIKSPKDSDINTSNDLVKEVVFFMTKDAHIIVCDSTTGHIIASQSIHLESNAISMYIVEGNLSSGASGENQSENSPQNTKTKNEPDQTNANYGSNPVVAELETSTETAYFGQLLVDLFVLLCCEDAFWLYPLKSVIQGDSNSIQEVHLLKPCCWTTTFKKNEKECGLLVLYRTGDIEIRSLPNFEVVAETSLMSILRWNFKTNMEKTLCSSESGQIVLINDREFAFISLLPWENDFRIPESLPHLHDKVLEAAADAAINFSPSQKKEEVTALGILGGIVKGFKADKIEHNVNVPEVSINTSAHLESIFSCPPFLKPSTAITDDQKVVELNIDDIDIDGPLVISSSSQMSKNVRKDKGTEKERLFEGATAGASPRPRTVEEIKAKYKKAGDASSTAAQARDKLAERGEKLERLRDRTEELQSGAENFADLANELAKRMEKRKWWHI